MASRSGGVRGRCAVAVLAVTALCATAPVAANPLRCTQGSAERSIEVVYSTAGAAVPCEVVYRKPASGITDVLWRADHQAGYCEARAEDLAATLRAAGWDCRAEGAPAAMEDALLEPEMVGPDRVPPDRVAPDRVAPDRVAPDRVAPDRVAPN